MPQLGQRRKTLALSRILGVPGARIVVPGVAEPVVEPGYVASMISRSPAPGRFYQVGSRDGDGLSKIARDALDAYQEGLGDDRQTRAAFMQCLTAGRRWNSRTYCSSYTSPTFPAHLLLEGYGLGRAFEPWHADAIACLRAGQWPIRAIDTEGKRTSRAKNRTKALLWVPRIDGFVLHEDHWLPVCGEIDPPRVLLDTLRSPTPG